MIARRATTVAFRIAAAAQLRPARITALVLLALFAAATATTTFLLLALGNFHVVRDTRTTCHGGIVTQIGGRLIGAIGRGTLQTGNFENTSLQIVWRYASLVTLLVNNAET